MLVNYCLNKFLRHHTYSSSELISPKWNQRVNKLHIWFLSLNWSSVFFLFCFVLRRGNQIIKHLKKNIIMNTWNIIILMSLSSPHFLRLSTIIGPYLWPFLEQLLSLESLPFFMWSTSWVRRAWRNPQHSSSKETIFMNIEENSTITTLKIDHCYGQQCFFTGKNIKYQRNNYRRCCLNYKALNLKIPKTDKSCLFVFLI